MCNQNIIIYLNIIYLIQIPTKMKLTVQLLTQKYQISLFFNMFYYVLYKFYEL